MLEPMDAFFEARIDGYDAHMLAEIAGAMAFYPFTAEQLPDGPVSVLDLGCGTGLELVPYRARNPQAEITGIDLSQTMLDQLQARWPGDPNLHLICGSYLDLPLGENLYDAAVSVESLHHFPPEEKLGLYRKLRRALRKGGFFVLTDYFAEGEREEQLYFQELRRLKAEQGIGEETLCHYDTPLTVEHEMAVLQEAGFAAVEVLARWENTCCVRAMR